MKNLKELYLEHEAKITDNLPDIKHVDLWSEQVSFLMDEQPFRAPAIFIAYRTLRTEDVGDKIQKVRIGVDLYYYYETFAATKRGSKKQEKALNFLEELTNIHKVFHGSSGEHYSDMRRVAFAPVETGTANLLYVQKFECTVVDDSAAAILEETDVEKISVVNEEIIPPAEDDYYPIIEVN